MQELIQNLECVQKNSKKSAAAEFTNGPDWYYFYQCSDGQNYFLHPLDVKIFKCEFGNYENFPKNLKLPVISICESTVTAELRKRCKYLAHLPLSCDINFCELDLAEIISADTLANFEGKDQLISRRNKCQAGIITVEGATTKMCTQ
jgi:hypothetical protein